MAASMDLVRRETDRGTAPEFAALDIRDDPDSPEADAELTMDASFPGKGLERERNEDANPPSTGVAGVYEKHAVPVHVDGIPMEHLHPSTPTAVGAKRRRAGRRVPGWRDPRKILFAFAALDGDRAVPAERSSMGTLILLYFTLSMGKMASGQADGE